MPILIGVLCLPWEGGGKAWYQTSSCLTVPGKSAGANERSEDPVLEQAGFPVSCSGHPVGRSGSDNHLMESLP